MDCIKERYLKYKSALDKYTGYVVSRLNYLSTNFAISPSYFDFEYKTGIIKVIERKRKVKIS